MQHPSDPDVDLDSLERVGWRPDTEQAGLIEHCLQQTEVRQVVGGSPAREVVFERPQDFGVLDHERSLALFAPHEKTVHPTRGSNGPPGSPAVLRNHSMGSSFRPERTGTSGSVEPSGRLIAGP
jgi:hypothetical protein